MRRGKPNRAGHTRWLALAVLAAAACNTVPALVPASGSASAIGRRTLAVESRRGLTVTADGGSWNRWPRDLPVEVTPVWITLHNTTGRPLVVQYEEFGLLGSSGAWYRALAPYDLRARPPASTFQVPNGGYFDGFRVAAYLAPSYPWLPVWDGPLPYGPCSRSVARRPGLPSDSMVDRALPEGVLQNGGTAAGYLYFQKVGGRERRVTFSADLRAPRPGERLASIDIPFRRVIRSTLPRGSIYATPRGPDWSSP